MEPARRQCMMYNAKERSASWILKYRGSNRSRTLIYRLSMSLSGHHPLRFVFVVADFFKE